MRVNRGVVAAVLISVWPASVGLAEEPVVITQPVTLAECFALALKRSEEIAIRQEVIRETEGRFIQSISAVLPRVSYAMSEKRQDGSGSSAFTLRDVPERKFTFTQPLFSGFKEFAAMAGSRAERRQRKAEYQRAEQLLFVDVADAFHFLLEHQEDLEALATTRTALEGRIKELEQREALGRSRLSEIASARAKLRRTEAELARVESESEVARQLMEFLTGLSHPMAITDGTLHIPLLEEKSAYVAKGDARPDVHAAREAWQVARKSVGIAQAKFWPTVNLEGNDYTKRAGVSQDINWDVTLKVDVPLFQGGQAVGAVREASAKAREAKWAFAKVAREAQLEIWEAVARVQGAMARQAALERALEASEEDYRLQVEDYRHNLVNNLDVLTSLQDLQDARRDAIHAKHETMRAYWRLLVATGETL